MQGRSFVPKETVEIGRLQKAIARDHFRSTTTVHGETPKAPFQPSKEMTQAFSGLARQASAV
jgi:hypothetical protein